MAVIDIAYSDYVRNLRCNAQAAAVLTARVLKAAYDAPPANIAAALRDIEAKGADVAEVQSERDRLGPARLRLMRVAFANGWGAMHEALIATTRVPIEVSNRAKRGTAILDSVFPDGVTFVLLDAEAAWSEGTRRVERLTAEGFKVTLDELIGADFFTTVEKVTKDLADAIGTGDQPHVVPSTTALQEALGALARAVDKYGRLMVATCDEDSPASVERFLRAMQPIDAHRASVRSGSGGDDDLDVDVPPVAPVTPVTPIAPSPASP